MKQQPAQTTAAGRLSAPLTGPCTQVEALTPKPKPLLALALLTCSLAGAWLVVESSLGFWGVPHYLRDLFAPRNTHLSIVAFCLMLLWTGLAASLIARLVIRLPRYAIAFPIGVLAAGIVGFALVRYSIRTEALEGVLGRPILHWPWAAEHLVRFLALYGGVSLLLVVGSATCGAVGAFGLRRGTKLGLLLLVCCLPWLALARIVVVNAAATENLTRLIDLRSFGELYLILLLGLLSVNAAVLAAELRSPRVTRLFIVALITAAAVGPGWLLLKSGLAANLTQDGSAVSAIQLLLGPDAKNTLSDAELFYRWGFVQLGAVLVLAAGQLAHLLPLPSAGRPDLKPIGQSASAPWPRKTYIVLLLCYLTFVIYGSLVPLEYHYVPLREAWQRFLNIRYLSLGIASRADLVANLLLLIPLAFFSMGALASRKAGSGRWVRGAAVLLAGALLAGAIEFTQVYFPARTVSLNDILAEVAGSAIGVVCWFLGGRRITAWAQAAVHTRDANRWALTILRGYLVILVLYQLLPFDATIRPTELHHRLQVGRVTLVPFRDAYMYSLYAVISKAAVLIPVGFLFCLQNPRHSVCRSALLGAAFASGIEFLQVFIVSRVASSTDVILGSLGAWLGAQLAVSVGPVGTNPWTHRQFWLRNRRWIKLISTLAWLGALAWFHWRPFNFAWPSDGLWTHLGRVVQIPFYHQYYMSEFLASAEMARLLTVSLVLGLLLKSQSSDGSYLRAIAVVVIFGLLMEAGRVFLPAPGRGPDIVRACVFIAGGMAGVWVYPRFARSFLARPVGEEELAQRRDS